MAYAASGRRALRSGADAILLCESGPRSCSRRRHASRLHTQRVPSPKRATVAAPGHLLTLGRRQSTASSPALRLVWLGAIRTARTISRGHGAPLSYNASETALQRRQCNGLLSRTFSTPERRQLLAAASVRVRVRIACPTAAASSRFPGTSATRGAISLPVVSQRSCTGPSLLLLATPCALASRLDFSDAFEAIAFGTSSGQSARRGRSRQASSPRHRHE